MRRFNASTYVPAEPQPGELDPLMEHALTSGLERDVLVPVLQNLGVGMGMLLLALIWMFVRVDQGASNLATLEILTRASYWGGSAFAFLMIVRGSADEVQMLAYNISHGWAKGRTNKELSFYKEEVQRLHMENRQQAAQMAQMVKNVRVSTLTDELPQNKPRVVEDEYTEPLRDALALCRFHEAHNTIAREKAMSAGMTRNRWDAARRLLASSGVPINGSVFGVPVVVAMGYVREYVAKQRSAPAGFVMPNED